MEGIEQSFWINLEWQMQTRNKTPQKSPSKAQKKQKALAEVEQPAFADSPQVSTPLPKDTTTPSTATESPTKSPSKSQTKPNAVPKLFGLDKNLSFEATQQRLAILEAEKHQMQQYVSHISKESRIRLEASLEELKVGIDQKLSELSDRLQTLYLPDAVTSALSGKHHGSKYGRKVFFPQESTLSKMLHYDDENYKTIFNIMICVLVLWGLSLAYEDYDNTGLPNFDLLVWGVFKDLQNFLQSWACMLVVYTLSAVYLSHFAATASGRLSYSLVLFVYIVTQLSGFAFSAWVVTSRHDPFSMPLAIGFMAEQTRMAMKTHSYFREKICWNIFDSQYSCQPRSSSASHLFLLGFALPESDYMFRELEKFAFFLFVPTLVYRDQYPRTARIRWSFVLLRLAEFLGIIYFAFLLFRQALPQFRSNVGEKMDSNFFIKATFSCMGPAMASMVFTHFLVLHVVQNIGAELTRFADRKFYEDWWNSRTFSVFYRKWNGVVHDWIHAYLYADLVQFVRMPKLWALLSSFIISAIVHEYLICVAMGFFLPILGILFTGPGLIFILLTKNKTGRIWNIFMWLMLSVGNASLMVLYSKEYFARSQGSATDVATGKPWEEFGLYDFFIPRIYRIQFPEQFQT